MLHPEYFQLQCLVFLISISHGRIKYNEIEKTRATLRNQGVRKWFGREGILLSDVQINVQSPGKIVRLGKHPSPVQLRLTLMAEMSYNRQFSANFS
jgi:hypothetical protein